MSTTPFELTQYYANLLILEYVGKPRAYATIQLLASLGTMPQISTQTITFSVAPTSGAFVLSYNAVSSAPLNWNDSSGTIQTVLQAVTGLGAVTVSGSISGLALTIDFTGVPAPALPLVLVSSSLQAAGVSITPVILETDVTLPLAVQNAFNLIGSNPAQGVQLDVIGKYAGVTRSGYNSLGEPITLNDSDFLTLIQFAILKNSAGSSLSTIQDLLFKFFPDEILVFDYRNMRMSYLISSSIGSQNLVELLVSEGLLPKPMGVQLSVTVYYPTITNFFGFRTYDLPSFNAKPFNTYDDYNLTWPWLSYADGI